jgi:hypothetical protein
MREFACAVQSCARWRSWYGSPVHPENPSSLILLTSCCLEGKVGSSIVTIPERGVLFMPAVVYAFLSTLGALFRSQLSLRVENVALRHQLAIYQRTVKRPSIRPEDRILWCWLSRRWARWREVLVFVQPETVIAWQRKRFRDHWTRMGRAGKPGRPLISEEIRELIRKVSGANPLWGTPRIVGELGKLGIKVSEVNSGQIPCPI